MGRFDDYDVKVSEQPARPPSAQSLLGALESAARSVPCAPQLRTRTYRAALVKLLQAEGWKVRTHVRVDGRGTNDGYRGVLDLVAHPPRDPAAPATQPLAPPVLVEIDKASIQRKTLAKLARWEGPHAGKVVILTRAEGHPDVQGLDAVIPLA